MTAGTKMRDSKVLNNPLWGTIPKKEPIVGDQNCTMSIWSRTSKEWIFGIGFFLSRVGYNGHVGSFAIQVNDLQV